MGFISLSNGIKKKSNDFGTVFLYEDCVYRVIEKKYKDQVEAFVLNSPFMDRLHEAGLVETFIAPVRTEKYNFMLEHKKIDFNSYLNEWPLVAKIDSALMVINLLEELVKEGWCLWDGHHYNILLDFTEPKWIDFHSIIPFTLTTAWWNEFREFIFNEIVPNNPTWNSELDEINKTSATSREGVLVFLGKIKEAILAVPNTPVQTPWFSYPRLNDTDLDDKQIGTLKLMERVKPYCETFLDIGGNVGWYSRAASRMGYKTIVTDMDEACIAESYVEAKKTGDNVLSLVSDFKSCLDILPGMYISFADRLNCDVSLSLALLHHLVFFQDCDFPFIAERLNALSKKAAIVQFMTREDSYVQHWIKTGTKNYEWYTMDNFILEMSKYFSKHEIFESVPMGRKLILFER